VKGMPPGQNPFAACGILALEKTVLLPYINIPAINTAL